MTEDNIFEKLIGKCSVYKDLTRAAGATYTAQEFNLLNDLNNLTVNGRKLEKEEKVQIIEEVKTANTVNMRKILKRVIGEELETLTGARIDKKKKNCFIILNSTMQSVKHLKNRDGIFLSYPGKNWTALGTY